MATVMAAAAVRLGTARSLVGTLPIVVDQEAIHIDILPVSVPRFDGPSGNHLLALPTIQRRPTRLRAQHDSSHPQAEAINGIPTAAIVSRNACTAQDAAETIEAHDCVALAKTRRIRWGNPFRDGVVIIEVHTGT